MKITRHCVLSQYLKPSKEMIDPYINIQKMKVQVNFQLKTADKISEMFKCLLNIQYIRHMELQ